MIFELLALVALVFTQDRPIGYGRSATGGTGGKVVQVATQAELKDALKYKTVGDTPMIIVITKNITFGEEERISEIIVNKTILGIKGVRLITNAQVVNGGVLNFKAGSNNIIVRNIIFEGPGAYDTNGNDLVSNNGATNLWVDHCEFYDGVDGNFDNSNDADNVTISWTKFGYKKTPKAGGSGGSDDHRYTNLVGGSSSKAPPDGKYSITFQYVYWGDGCKERMPRARNAEIHVLNCYYNTSVAGSLALGLEGGSNGLGCYVEGSHFKNIGEIYRSYDGSSSKPHTLTFVDCLSTLPLPSNIGTTPKPSYSYSVSPVKDVEATVSKGAGATLTVSTSGTVS